MQGRRGELRWLSWLQGEPEGSGDSGAAQLRVHDARCIADSGDAMCAHSVDSAPGCTLDGRQEFGVVVPLGAASALSASLQHANLESHTAVVAK